MIEDDSGYFTCKSGRTFWVGFGMPLDPAGKCNRPRRWKSEIGMNQLRQIDGAQRRPFDCWPFMVRVFVPFIMPFGNLTHTRAAQTLRYGLPKWFCQHRRTCERGLSQVKLDVGCPKQPEFPVMFLRSGVWRFHVLGSASPSFSRRLTSVCQKPTRWQLVFASAFSLAFASSENSGCKHHMCLYQAPVSKVPSGFHRINPEIQLRFERGCGGSKRVKVSP